MNDFKKLDHFMRAHKPPTAAAGSVPLPPKRPWAMPAALLTCSLALALFVTTTAKQRALDEEALAMAETMEWDFTADETPAEVAEMVALLD